MRANTFFTPFIERGRFVTTDEFCDYVPESRYWQFTLADMSDDDKRCAHIGPNDEMVDLYSPNSDEACDYIVYSSQADLHERLKRYAEDNTNVRRNSRR